MKTKKSRCSGGMVTIVNAPGVSPKELNILRREIEKSMLDPNHVIITNYMFDVKQVFLNQN